MGRTRPEELGGHGQADEQGVGEGGHGHEHPPPLPGQAEQLGQQQAEARVTATPTMAEATISPAWSRLSWSRLFSSPVMQLQGTAMLTMNLLRNRFSAAVIQPSRPIK